MPIARERLTLLLLLWCAPAVALPAELGTLFHSPEERARLERLRRGEQVESPGVTIDIRPPSVTGFVRRSDGRNTVWINGVPVAVAGARGDALMDPGTVDSGKDRPVRIERDKPAEVKR